MADTAFITDLEEVLRRHEKNREVPEQIVAIYLQQCLIALEDAFLNQQIRFGKQILASNAKIAEKARRCQNSCFKTNVS